jgi:hypothetical protein
VGPQISILYSGSKPLTLGRYGYLFERVIASVSWAVSCFRYRIRGWGAGVLAPFAPTEIGDGVLGILSLVLGRGAP